MSPSLFDRLNQHGLNLQAVLKVADLPASIRSSLEGVDKYTNLLLIGHAGREFWQAFNASPWGNLENPADPHPIDRYTRESVTQCLATYYPDVSYRWLYPSDQRLVDLQALGRLAGWHGESPFRLGVKEPWGPWYAYRAAILCSPLEGQPETNISTDASSPCQACEAKPCVSACPASALGDTHADFQLQACLDYRLKPNSPCANQCIARSACPVGKEHRYSREQMHYHYGVSLAMIRKWQK